MDNPANTEHKTYCQSCSMPLETTELMGTEKDGSTSHEYCRYCYQNGTFINPGMSLEEMKTLVKEKMTEMKIDPGVIALSVGILPQLKRWRSVPVL